MNVLMRSSPRCALRLWEVRGSTEERRDYVGGQRSRIAFPHHLRKQHSIPVRHEAILGEHVIKHVEYCDSRAQHCDASHAESCMRDDTPSSPSCSFCFARSLPPTIPIFVRDRRVFKNSRISGVACCRMQLTGGVENGAGLRTFAADLPRRRKSPINVKENYAVKRRRGSHGSESKAAKQYGSQRAMLRVSIG